MFSSEKDVQVLLTISVGSPVLIVKQRNVELDLSFFAGNEGVDVYLGKLILEAG